jgi:hypothetical protein
VGETHGQRRAFILAALAGPNPSADGLNPFRALQICIGRRYPGVLPGLFILNPGGVGAMPPGGLLAFRLLSSKNTAPDLHHGRILLGGDDARRWPSASGVCIVSASGSESLDVERRRA